ncbi:MAG: dihydroorotase [Clostridiales bacterium]|nr:dihydroorotase [Clostridiales bacterium]
MSILIKGGRVIDPANSIDEVRDVLVCNGEIVKVEKDIEDKAERIIDTKGKWVMPGLIDLHVHFREPGFERKETIRTGSRAAAMGGFTTVCCMPNTEPVVDNDIVVEFVKLKAERAGIVNVLPIGAISKGMKGEELSDIGRMASAGICALSEDGKSVLNSALMKNAMRYAKMFNLPVFDHCEDPSLTGKGQMNAGAQAAYMGLAGISNDSEEVIVARDMILAESTNTAIHLCHISTKGSVTLIRQAKERGVKVTAEATPHHFTLCDEDITDYDANFKMAPPLRSKEDREAVRQALKDGTIEVISTDHAPHHIDEKNCEFQNALNGIIGLETSFPLANTELVEGGYLTPCGLVEKMSYNPGKILHNGKGTLSVGAAADITIADPNEEYIIDVEDMVSKAKNTPFGGRKVKGRILYTVVGGEIVVENGVLVKL